ncbi:MAG: serine/threonine protein kinase [Granulosicoccus sp.]
MYLLTEQQADTAGFKLLDLKASGGTSIVYKAQHKATEKTVALKVLNPGGNPQRIQREARVLSTLEHPNIATFIAVGEIGSMVYVATRWIEGTTLRQWMILNTASNQALVNVDVALSLIRSIAGALTHIHSNGIAHGDINPNNILISRNQEATLVDFGIGRTSCDQTVTATSELAGTPRYLAPELIAGNSPSADSDQYAFALVAYEMLTGQWPFPEHRSNAATALHHQLYSKPAPICELRPSLPATTDQVFTRALSKLPNQRFENVKSFCDALSKAAFTIGTNTEECQLTSRASRPRIAMAFALVGLTVASLWWSSDETPTPILASVGTDKPIIINSISTTETADKHSDHQCNLYVNSKFDVKLEDNFYQDALYAELATRVDYPAAAASPVLQVGDSDQYGNYGIILEVTSGQQYSFSADLMFKDYVHKAELTILWLDEFWQIIEGEEDTLTIKRRFYGTFHLPSTTAPDDAHYAVPTLYKDASAGIMYADNVMFSAIGESCN